MPLKIIRNDITKVSADAIVNPANKELQQGNGTSHAIFCKAGEKELSQACKNIGSCEPGCAVITPAFRLPAKYIIHAVGPLYIDGNCQEAACLTDTYRAALRLAVKHHCQSIAFPLLSSGMMRFPRQEALQIAVSTISAWLLEHEMDVLLVVYDAESFVLSQRIFPGVIPAITDGYVRSNPEKTHFAPFYTEEDLRDWQYKESMKEEIDRLLDLPREDFPTMMVRLIQSKRMKNSTVYREACIDRREYHRVLHQEQKPSKDFIAKMALALKLTAPETKTFLAKAGLALSDAERFDILLDCFLRNKYYDVLEFKTCLQKRGIPLAGNFPPELSEEQFD